MTFFALFRVAVAAVIVAVALGWPIAGWTQGTCAPGCGPDACVGDSRYQALLDRKKRELAREYPPRLLALLDRASRCVQQIERAPDAFTLLPVQPNGDSRTVLWDEDQERVARQQLLSGELRVYYIFNARRAHACCGERHAEERPDWRDGVSTAQAIVCTRSGTGSAATVRCTGE